LLGMDAAVGGREAAGCGRSSCRRGENVRKALRTDCRGSCVKDLRIDALFGFFFFSFLSPFHLRSEIPTSGVNASENWP